MEKTIHHEPDTQRFTVTTGGEPAVLDYFLLEPEDGNEAITVDFTSTYVPAEYRGQGIAEALVRHGLRWANAQGFDVQASCWYVAKFLRR